MAGKETAAAAAAYTARRAWCPFTAGGAHRPHLRRLRLLRSRRWSAGRHGMCCCRRARPAVYCARAGSCYAPASGPSSSSTHSRTRLHLCCIDAVIVSRTRVRHISSELEGQDRLHGSSPAC
eukprot:359094-Chlamydomonas_euryale.AAC.19